MEKLNNNEMVKNVKFFDTFLKLFTEHKLKIKFQVENFNFFYSSNDVSFDDEENEMFKDFIRRLIRELRKKVLFNEVSKDFEQYVNKILDENKSMENEIKVKCTTNIDTIDKINYEILTKRNRNLDQIAYSALISMRLKKSCGSVSQKNVELSIKDLENLKDIIEDALKDINYCYENKR